MIALVTGANGCIGTALLRELMDSGDYREVRALIRKPEAEADLPTGVRAVRGDLEDADALRRAAQEATVVFHTAAKVHDAHGTAADFRRVNVEGTRRLLDACAASNAARPTLVHFSTVAVYGDTTPPDGLPEDAPVNPATPYARSKVEAEGMVSAWGREHGVSAVNLRVATVYGPRDRGNVARMIDAIVRGKYISIGPGLNRKTFVAVRNVARAARLSSLSRADAVVQGSSFVVADPSSYSLRELEDAIRKAADIISERRFLPAPLMLRLAWLAEVTAKTLPQRRMSATAKALRQLSGQIRRLTSDNVYHVKTLRLIPGYVPPVATLDEGITEAVAWYRSQASGQSS